MTGRTGAFVRYSLVPLRDQARRVIKKNRFWIPSLRHFPGMPEVSRKGKAGRGGFGSDDFLGAGTVAARPGR